MTGVCFAVAALCIREIERETDRVEIAFLWILAIVAMAAGLHEAFK